MAYLFDLLSARAIYSGSSVYSEQWVYWSQDRQYNQCMYGPFNTNVFDIKIEWGDQKHKKTKKREHVIIVATAVCLLLR